MSHGNDLALRVSNKWRRLCVAYGWRRQFQLRSDRPYVSFTFDDFPRSAFLVGARVLQKYGTRGTFFVSMQLLDSGTSVGQIASRDDIRTLLREGHELGCHTFDHLDGTIATPEAFAASIVANRSAFEHEFPGERFRTFAYPLDGPGTRVKPIAGDRFVCCRGGGQAFNAGVIDLALLKAYFLDGRNANDLDAVADIISRNAAASGWLIFATHDVAESPSRYGCQPGFLDEVVRLSVRSGARVLPVLKACEELQIVPGAGMPVTS